MLFNVRGMISMLCECMNWKQFYIRSTTNLFFNMQVRRHRGVCTAHHTDGSSHKVEHATQREVGWWRSLGVFIDIYDPSVMNAE